MNQSATDPEEALADFYAACVRFNGIAWISAVAKG